MLRKDSGGLAVCSYERSLVRPGNDREKMVLHRGSNAFDHFVDQEHAAYPAVAHGVWRQVLARNAALIAQNGERMNPEYIQGMRELELPLRVPRIEYLNRRLAPTGWQAVCVDGYIPSDAYASLIAQRIFPISRGVRRPEHVDFAPDPDLVHDVLGHLPMLFSPQYRTYLQRFGAVMLQASSNSFDDAFFESVRRLASVKSDPASSPAEVLEVEASMRGVIQATGARASELTHLRRLYVWSIEFGVMGSEGDFSIHGAALLSAPAEFRGLCTHGAACLRPFDVGVIEQENAFSDLLNQYFVARDFSHLHEVLSEYELRMSHRQGAARTSEIRSLATGVKVGRVDHA
jgi:phenylalanine-4-hydroxylase